MLVKRFAQRISPKFHLLFIDRVNKQQSYRHGGYTACRRFENHSVPVKNAKGIHDLFFVFKGGKDLFNFDWWQFNR